MTSLYDYLQKIEKARDEASANDWNPNIIECGEMAYNNFRAIGPEHLVFGIASYENQPRHKPAKARENATKDAKFMELMANEIKTLLEIIRIQEEALKASYENCNELQPNSGHMYLANVNFCFKKTKEAIDKVNNLVQQRGVK